MGKNLVIIPTYNEIENVEKMVRSIFALPTLFHLLIVDDGSPDGTANKVRELQQEFPNTLFLEERKGKLGLGTAYIHGFKWALKRDFDYIFEMDCDFSHAPWDLPRLVHRSRTADLVIGSRYVPGGGTENWNASRRFVSRCGNTYASLFLGSIIHDWTGGFRCYRRELLTRMNLRTVRTKGYIFQVELAWRAVQLGADVVELPIRFCDRIEGQSKLGWQSIAEALMEVPKMYLLGLSGR